MSKQATTTVIGFRLSTQLREEIQKRAAAQGRTESNFIRFHLGRMFAIEEEESKEDEGTGES